MMNVSFSLRIFRTRHHFFHGIAKNMSTLAKDKYKIERGNFNTPKEKDLNFFQSFLSKTQIITNADDLQSYNTNWLSHYEGCGKIVLRPQTTDEVSKILSYCDLNRLAVCPQAGNTSVSGGSFAIHDEIIISTSLMNKIIHFDELSDVIICEAGCILQNLDDFLKDKQLMMPVNIAAKGSCQIGGNVATNAGGLKVLKYGTMHGSVLGLEVVKADGEIVDCLNTLKKDNTGYHLKHLFIGSEGTLGIITKVAIQCVPLPTNYSVAFLGLDSFDKVLKTFKLAKRNLNDSLSSCEMMDFESMDMVETHLKLKSPVGKHPFYMLIETSAFNEHNTEDKLDPFLEYCLNENLIVNGTVTSDPGKCKALWDIRERFAESMKLDGYVLIYDLSFPLNDFYTLVPEMKEKLGNKCHRVTGMGHLGDGNLHLQICLPKYDEKLKEYMDDIVYTRVRELKGSVSAEHGIGFLKRNILHYTKSKSSIKMMRNIKDMMDPNGILNPYKVIPN